MAPGREALVVAGADGLSAVRELGLKTRCLASRVPATRTSERNAVGLTAPTGAHVSRR